MKRKPIPRPGAQAITPSEADFVRGAAEENTPAGKGRARGRQISMTDEFFAQMNIFLDEFPVEGTRSAMVVRAVDEYMRRVRTERGK